MKARAIFMALALAGPGCGVLHSVDHAPREVVAIPDGFSHVVTSTAAEAEWWKTFSDDGLNRAVDAVLANNLDLKAAYARMDQMQAIENGADAAYWPQLQIDGGAQRSRIIFNPQFPAFIANQFNLSGAASYEVDVWGRVHSTASAADQDALASRADLSALAISLAAQTAELWYAIRERRAQEALLNAQLKTNETYLELMELRFSQGLTDALAVLQQKQQVAAIKGQLPPVRAARADLEANLYVLLGQTPDAKALIASAETDLPPPPPLPAVGLPVEVLRARPDVTAAHLRVLSADYRVGAAIADYFPTLRLSASAGFRAFNLADLFSNWIWNLGASLLAPVFDGGRRVAEHDRTKAVVEERLANYGNVVLRALSEVESTIIQETEQRQLLLEIDDQLRLSRSTLREARRRYSNGLSDYLPVLTALRGVQQLEQGELTAARRLISLRVQLHRALGGSWTANLKRPQPVAAEES